MADKREVGQGHTPGPWKIYKRDGKHINGANISNGSINVCRLPYSADRPLGRKEADAHLIGAAPDLLLACQRVLEWLDAKGYSNDDRSFGVRAAIAKATNQEASS